MFRVKVHNRIEQIISLLYRVRIWHRGAEETVAELRLKIFSSIYYCLLPISLIAGALASDNQDEFVFSAQTSMMSVVLLVKLLYIIWRKSDILEQLNRICDYDVDDQKIFTQINNELNILMKFGTILFSLCYFCSICIGLVVPFLSTERSFFFNIGFPLDYKNNEFAYWMAFTFIFTEVLMTVISLLFSAIVWYLMANCGLRYVVLGQQIKVMGEIELVDETPKRKISHVERDNTYERDLLEAVASHQHLKELTNHMNSFLSKLFAVQLITSVLCICTSVYCLAFNRADNFIENIIYLTFLLYNIFDIFVIMYFGNEIKLRSDRLSYSLFESDWVDRSQSIKNKVLIFGEFLMQPHQMVIFKLYPITMETFTRILNSTSPCLTF